eukprot:Sspe_Gene.91007::Locus_62490_Transcript_1_2_Confidence_0.667_Length_1554::g.91007::m.91007
MCGTALVLVLLSTVYHVSSTPTVAVPHHVRSTRVPTASQQEWMDLEVGGIINYGIGMPGAPWVPNGTVCCCGKTAPPARYFNSRANMTSWVETLQLMGAGYSVFTASGGCGFLMWNTSTRLPDGTMYNYTVRESQLAGHDVLREYMEAMRGGGVRPGLYFQLAYDYWLGWQHGKMAPNGEGAPKLTPSQFFAVSQSLLGEVWGGYGDYTELWFDGGLQGWPKDAADGVRKLLSKLQPNAVAFQSPLTVNAVRWIGNEAGKAPLPNWINAAGALDYGHGSATGTVVAPAEADTPVSNGTSIWWWSPKVKVKTLAELAEEYDDTVGHSANMLIGLLVDYTGNIPDDQRLRLAEFGSWVRKCYGSPTARRQGVLAAGDVVVPLPRTPIDRIWLREDLRNGEDVTLFSVELLDSSSTPLNVTWVVNRTRTATNPTYTSSSVGNKRIVKLASPVAEAGYLRVTTLASLSPFPRWREIAAFAASPCTTR